MNFEKYFKLIIGLTALTGFIIEIIHHSSKGMNPLELLTFFTIQSNIIVVMYCFASLRKKNFFFNGPGFAGLAMLNIIITGIIFFLMLRTVYQPTGLGFYGNIIEHYVVPIMMGGDFLLSRSRAVMRYMYIIPWIGYAACYLVLALIKGAAGFNYPYPFLDIDKHGAGQVFVNVLVIGCGFALVAALIVAVDRWLKRKSKEIS